MISKAPQYSGMQITFNITEDCNLKCRYCYELDKQPKDLPLDYAKKFIDIILADPDPILATDTDDEWIIDSGLCMDMIGGDALMRPKLCTDILEYWMWASIGHKWGTRWRVSISTNGTLFDEPGVKEFLERFCRNMSLGVSVDGCPEIHNLNRSNSMEKLVRGWPYYVDYCKRSGIVPNTKATLNRESIPYLHKSLKFLHEDMGLNHVYMNFVFEPMGETEDDLKELDRQMEKCVQYTLDHKSDLFWSMLDRDFRSCTPDPKRGWCGAGAMPALGVNGKIYPCFRFLPHTMTTRDLDFNVGDVWNGMNRKDRFVTVRNQTREKISPQKCRECQYEADCAWCIGGAFAEKGEFYRQTNICGVHLIQDKWTDIYWREHGSNA